MRTFTEEEREEMERHVCQCSLCADAELYGVPNPRIQELEAALTDALYAWGLVDDIVRRSSYYPLPEHDGDWQEARERIQRARLALPKAQEVTG